MNRFLSFALIAAGLASAGSCPGPAFGQNDPFGAAPAADPAAKPAPGAAKAAAAQAPVKENPFLAAVRETNPTTAAELMKAVQLVYDAGEKAETQLYLQKLIAAKPDLTTLAGFQETFGTAFFLRLMRDDAVQPEGSQVARAVMQAGPQVARDPQRLAGLVAKLGDPAQEVRSLAINDLRRAGHAAVAPLVQALADPAQAAKHAAVQQALGALGSEAIEPLIGVLGSPDPALRARVMPVLGYLRAGRAISYLVRPAVQDDDPAVQQAARQALADIARVVPTRADAEKYLFKKAQGYFDGNIPVAADETRTIPLWVWDPATRSSVLRRFLPEDSSMIETSRLAADLFELDPANVDYRRLYLTARLQADKLRGGIDRPVPRGAGTAHALIVGLGLDAAEDTFEYAVKTRRMPAAIAAAEVLAAVGDHSLLDGGPGHPRPLVQALRHPDRRLRFAALEAILTIDPRENFSGASFVMETLGYFVRTFGSRRVLIGHPKIAEGQSLVGMFAELGFESDTAQVGRDLLLKAVVQPDYEFILVTDAIDRPPANEVVQLLRRDPRTARVPIALLAREENVRNIRRLAELYGGIEPYPPPTSTAAVVSLIRRLEALAGRDLVSREERLRQATAALKWIRKFAENPTEYGLHDIRSQQASLVNALATPELSFEAARVLGLLGTPQAQLALVDLASQSARPLTDRQAAAAAFADAVRRRGTQLTSAEILLQYERFNQSERLDRATQIVLATILDAIETAAAKE